MTTTTTTTTFTLTPSPTTAQLDSLSADEMERYAYQTGDLDLSASLSAALDADEWINIASNRHCYTPQQLRDHLDECDTRPIKEDYDILQRDLDDARCENDDLRSALRDLLEQVYQANPIINPDGTDTDWQDAIDAANAALEV